MGNPHWPDALRIELAKKKLPRHYVRRLMDELHDHFEELKKEPGMDAQAFENMEQRLGSPEQIAQAAAVEYQSRSFFGRHPVMTFVVAPIPLILISFIASFLFAVLVGFSMTKLGAREHGWTTSTVSTMAVAGWWVLYVVMTLTPFAIAASILSYLGSRSGRSGWWSLGACLIVALVAWMFRAYLVLPNEPGTGRLQFGMGFPPWANDGPTMAPEALYFAMNRFFGGQFIQFLIPAAIGLLFFWRSSRSVRFAEPA